MGAIGTRSGGEARGPHDGNARDVSLQPETSDRLQIRFTQKQLGSETHGGHQHHASSTLIPPVHLTIGKLGGMVTNSAFQKSGSHNFLRKDGFCPPVRQLGTSLNRLSRPVTLALGLGSINHIVLFLGNAGPQRLSSLAAEATRQKRA